MIEAFRGIAIGDRVLVTTSNWFYAPNGRTYRAAFGTLRSIQTAEQTLGVQPRQPSTNWYAQVGELLIAGCQIHYAVRTSTCELGDAEDWQIEGGKAHRVTRPSAIFDADRSERSP